MDAIKKTINDLPETVTINIPKHLVHRKAEIIILTENEDRQGRSLLEFYGSIPDFPERFPQGDYESRDSL